MSGATAKLYINGTLTDTFNGFPIPANVLRYSNFIGGDNFGSPFLQSDLDDLRIYKRPLNSTEINILYNFQPTTSSTQDSTMESTAKTLTTTTQTEAYTTSSFYTTLHSSIMSSAKESSYSTNLISSTETIVSTSLPSSVSITQLNHFSSTKSLTTTTQSEALTTSSLIYTTS